VPQDPVFRSGSGHGGVVTSHPHAPRRASVSRARQTLDGSNPEGQRTCGAATTITRGALACLRARAEKSCTPIPSDTSAAMRNATLLHSELSLSDGVCSDAGVARAGPLHRPTPIHYPHDGPGTSNENTSWVLHRRTPTPALTGSRCVERWAVVRLLSMSMRNGVRKLTA
jgi:hypothetical protein